MKSDHLLFSNFAKGSCAPFANLNSKMLAITQPGRQTCHTMQLKSPRNCSNRHLLFILGCNEIAHAELVGDCQTRHQRLHMGPYEFVLRMLFRLSPALLVRQEGLKLFSSFSGPCPTTSATEKCCTSASCCICRRRQQPSKMCTRDSPLRARPPFLTAETGSC